MSCLFLYYSAILSEKMNLTDQIKHIETRIDVGAIKIAFRGRRVQVYPWLKAKLFYKLITGAESMASPNKAMLIRQLKSFFYGFFNWFKSYNVWVFSSSEERIKDGKFYFDKLFDVLHNFSELKILHIELQLFKKFPIGAVKSPHIVSKSFFLLQEEIVRRLLFRKIDIENHALLEQICSELNIDIDIQKQLKKVLSQYLVMKFWLRIFKTPKVVLMTVSYANFGYILAFKERKIPVIEMQHGVISEGHHGYLYASTLDPINFPDVISVWSQEEAQFMTTGTQIPIATVQATGRTIIDYYAQNTQFRQAQKRVCVSLQDLELSDLLLETLLQINDKIEHPLDFYIQTRRTNTSDYQSKFEFPENFYFFEGNIYENILQSAIHVTVYSSSALESLALGTSNVFFDPTGRAQEIFERKLGANPYCHFLSTQTELLNYFNKASLAPAAAVRDASQHLFEPDAIENLKALLYQNMNENVSSL